MSKQFIFWCYASCSDVYYTLIQTKLFTRNDPSSLDNRFVYPNGSLKLICSVMKDKPELLSRHGVMGGAEMLLLKEAFFNIEVSYDSDFQTLFHYI